MRLDNFEPTPRRTLSKTVEVVQRQTDTLLESSRERFVFPVHEKIYAMQDRTVEGISEKELMKTMFSSMKDAWETAVEPKIGAIRNGAVGTIKGGTDFFTEADTASEKIIIQAFENAFPHTLQFFGEEANTYTGNTDAPLTIRIDPIDGTESMKFGKQNWGIMAGIYIGPHESAQQVMAAAYYPELHTVLYCVNGVGTFVSDTDSGDVKEISPVESQNNLGNVIVSYYRHSKKEERGANEKIIEALDQEGARIRSVDSTCTDVLEALMTRGQRIIIYDGDMSQVDYIPFTMLMKAGYKIYPWLTDEEISSEDPELKNKKVVIVPPGRAGEHVREILKRVYTEEYGS